MHALAKRGSWQILILADMRKASIIPQLRQTALGMRRGMIEGKDS